jgi:hypothetical protein
MTETHITDIARVIQLAIAPVFKMIGLMFVAGRLALIASLLAFLREIFLAVTSARNAVRLQLPLQRILSRGTEQSTPTRPAEERVSK